MRRFLGRRQLSSLKDLAKTPLYDLHVENRGKMVGYAGFALPVVYAGQTHVESHRWTRSHAGLFDVSHMVQHKFTGADATKFLETVTPSDIQALRPFTSTLSVLLNSRGGIVDDTIISRHGENDYYVVTNAGCREKDLAFLKSQMENLDVEHQLISGALLALQGPEAAGVLQKLTNFDLSEIGFGQSAFAELSGTGKRYHIARGGYTGEDGFEISIPDNEFSVEFAKSLLKFPAVQPVGLAARDSLRLEAGMCLYGHELTEDIDPVSARLAWVIGKRRRAEGGFNGAEAILKKLAEKSGTLRSGLISSGPAPRQGAKVYDLDGNLAGEITSGCLSPVLGKNIAMAYLPRGTAKTGTRVDIEIRGKKRPAEVVKMPFVATNYYRK